MSDEPKINVLFTGKIPMYPCGLKLEPGMNTLDKAAWDDAAKSEYMQAKIRAGLFRPQGAPPEPTLDHNPEKDAPPLELGKLKTKAALRAIEACEDPDQLEAWLATDGRLNVREAIIKRRYAIAEAAQEADETPDTGHDVKEG